MKTAHLNEMSNADRRLTITGVAVLQRCVMVSAKKRNLKRLMAAPECTTLVDVLQN